jgi:hypothetical protein
VGDGGRDVTGSLVGTVASLSLRTHGLDVDGAEGGFHGAE